MHLEPFQSWFPELGAKECRTIEFLPGAESSDSRIPTGRYAFVELYCTDPKCDCRRVALVVSPDGEFRPLATISFGFDRDEEMAGPFIDPLNYRCSYADEFLDLAEHLLFSDPHYVARLERHYYLLKEAAGMHPAKLRRRLDPAEVQQVIAEKKAVRRLRRKALHGLRSKNRGRR
jgi:hypothetical protein